MKIKNILLVIALFTITLPLHAQVFDFSNHSLSMQLETGVLYGTTYEIIYKSSHSADYNSELQWNIKPLWFVGSFMELAPKDPLANNSMFFNFDLKLGIPTKTGVMEDRDWLESSKPGSLTHFSSHDNYTTEAYLFNSATGFSIPLKEGFLAKISLNLMVIICEFEAKDGYTQYGTNTGKKEPPYNPWDPNFKKDPFDGLGIYYYQFWGAINPTFGLEWHKKKFIFKSAFSASTGILCFTVDKHYARNPPFAITGIFLNGLLLEAKGSVFYKISNNFSVGLSLAYTNIEGTRGDLTQEEKYEYSTDTINAPNAGGAGYKAFTGELMLKMEF